MRLLLDEMLPPAIARALRERGHDVVAIKEDPLCVALSDDEVMDYARAQRRAVVTNNVVDFRPLHHAAATPGGAGHLGLVFLPGRYRRTKQDVGRIVTALEAVLAAFPDEDGLAGGEIWL